MSRSPAVPPPDATRPRFGPLRVWHLCFLVLFVAVAIVNIQDQRIGEPTLILIAAGGFVVYALIGVLGWKLARRYRQKLGPSICLILYVVAMGALFLVATVAYLAIEHVYRNGL